MLKPSMLGLPLLLLGASCVPPAGGLNSSGSLSAAPAHFAAYGSAESLSDINSAEQGKLPIIDPLAIAPGPAAKPFVTGRQLEGDFRRSLDCLTAAVYYEARSETEEGQRAVAQVVLNRVRHPAFPNSVCGVVYQGSQRSTGCQFSFTCDGSMARRPEPSAWDRARKIAEDALSGTVADEVGLSTHYHTTAIRPWWAASLTKAVTVGSHIFYRWRGEWGKPLAFRQSYAATEPGSRSSATFAQPAVARASFQTEDGAKVTIHRGEAPAPSVAVQSASLVRVHRSASTETVRAQRLLITAEAEFEETGASVSPAEETSLTE